MNLQEVSYEKKLNEIIDMVETDDILRMGKLFSTRNNNYYYDTGTGKVILLDDEIYYIMSLWFSKDVSNYNKFINNPYVNESSLNEILDVCINENLLCAIKPTRLYTPYHYEMFGNAVENHMEQLILELTGKCNLRCKYCVYNDEYERNRAFNNSDMTQEIAKKSVDYFFDHSDKKMAITFYGGEPLLKFDLLKWVIEYSLEKNKLFNKKLSFSLTTNVTLVTEEIAEYLASVKELNVLCSIDGPEKIHDANRRTHNGEGSFEKAINGLGLLSKVFSSKGKRIGINAVFAPPYTYERLDEINDFFNSMSLPKDSTINITYPTSGSVDNKEWLKKVDFNPKYKKSSTGNINPLWEWKLKKISQGAKLEPINTSIVTAGLNDELLHINYRYISDKPNDVFSMNACCVPGKRRLYVDTRGYFYPCERIGTCPDIGNIDVGLDCNKVKKYYIDEYVNKSIDSCSNCWAIRLCSLCYAGRYSDTSFSPMEEACIGTRDTQEKALTMYHELLEIIPEQLEILNSLEMG